MRRSEGKSALFIVQLLKTIAISLAVGLAQVNCSGTDGASTADEPVKAQDSQAGAVSQDNAGFADNQAGDPNVAAPVASDGTQPGGNEMAVTPIEESMPGDPSAQPKNEAPPAGVVDESTGTVNAELTDAKPAAPAPQAVDNAAVDILAATPSAPPPAPEPAADLQTSASPGAAKYVKSKNEAKHHGHGAHETGSAGGAGTGVYVVQAGDSLGVISTRIFGTAKKIHELAEQNNLTTPYKIRVGDLLHFNAGDAQAKAYLAQQRANMKTVTVEKGDTLAKIAAKVMGGADKWKLLLSYNADKISNPNLILAGMKLAYLEPTATAAVAAPSEGHPNVGAAKEKQKGVIQPSVGKKVTKVHKKKNPNALSKSAE